MEEAIGEAIEGWIEADEGQTAGAPKEPPVIKYCFAQALPAAKFFWVYATWLRGLKARIPGL